MSGEQRFIATSPPARRAAHADKGYLARRLQHRSGLLKSRRHIRRLFSMAPQPSELDSEKPDYAMEKTRLCSSASCAGCGTAGNCSTVACWPSHSRVIRITCPSGNSSAS